MQYIIEKHMRFNIRKTRLEPWLGTMMQGKLFILIDSLEKKHFPGDRCMIGLKYCL